MKYQLKKKLKTTEDLEEEVKEEMSYATRLGENRKKNSKPRRWYEEILELTC